MYDRRPIAIRPAFSLMEMCFVVAIIAVLIAILLPRVQAARETARRMSCSNNFKQVALSIHNYHDAFKQLPFTCGGTGPTPGHDDWSNQRRLSANVGIVPFVESGVLWEMISNPFHTKLVPVPDEPEDEFYTKIGPLHQKMLNEMITADGPFTDQNGDHYFPEMGPAPWRANVYPPWQHDFSWITKSHRCRGNEYPGLGERSFAMHENRQFERFLQAKCEVTNDT